MTDRETTERTRDEWRGDFRGRLEKAAADTLGIEVQGNEGDDGGAKGDRGEEE